MLKAGERMRVNEFYGIDLSDSINPKLAKQIYESASPSFPTLIVDHEAIHAGRTRNHTIYPQSELKKALKSWTIPYQKPVLWNHESGGGMFAQGACKPFGRVIKAKYSESTAEAVASVLPEDSKFGTGASIVTASIRSPEAIQNIISEIFVTTSIGSSIETAFCNVCGANIKESDCGHQRGVVYERTGEEAGKKTKVCCGWIMNGLVHDEISYVNVPSDTRSRIIKYLQENYAGSERETFTAVATILSENRVIESAQLGKVVNLGHGFAFAWPRTGRAKPIMLSESADLPEIGSIARSIAALEYELARKNDSDGLVLGRLPVGSEYEAELAMNIATAMWEKFSETTGNEKHLEEIAKYFLTISNNDKVSAIDENASLVIKEYAQEHGILQVKIGGSMPKPVIEMSLQELIAENKEVKEFVEKSNQTSATTEASLKENEALKTQVKSLTENVDKATVTIKELNDKVEVLTKKLSELEAGAKASAEGLAKVQEALTGVEAQLAKEQEGRAMDAATHEAVLKDAIIEHILDLHESYGSFNGKSRETVKTEYSSKNMDQLRGSLEEVRKNKKSRSSETAGTLFPVDETLNDADNIRRLARSFVG
jgi:hypothetical protein